MIIKVKEGGRLFFICHIIGHWFKWRSLRGDLMNQVGDCRICGARRQWKLDIPPMPKPPNPFEELLGTALKSLEERHNREPHYFDFEYTAIADRRQKWMTYRSGFLELETAMAYIHSIEANYCTGGLHAADDNDMVCSTRLVQRFKRGGSKVVFETLRKRLPDEEIELRRERLIQKAAKFSLNQDRG